MFFILKYLETLSLYFWLPFSSFYSFFFFFFCEMVGGIEGIKMDIISGDCFVIVLFNIPACSSFNYLESV